jgi:Fe2+ transport system protein B
MFILSMLLELRLKVLQAERTARLQADLDAARTAIAEHEKSKALWAEKERKMEEAHDAEIEYTEHLMTEKERKMQEAHDAELEYTEHLVRPFYMSFVFFLWLLSLFLSLSFVIMSMPWRLDNTSICFGLRRPRKRNTGKLLTK